MRDATDLEAKAFKPASQHYTAYVGPPKQYDLMGATQFNLLCMLGLREHHYMLDFGCGSLRTGRLLIPYLMPGHYFGIEPNAWLIEDSIERQIGHDQIRIKQPTFSHNSDFDADKFGRTFDFIVAQSIFSHSGPDLTRKALASFEKILQPDGFCLVTFIEGDEDTPDGWYYKGTPKGGVVSYRPALIRTLLDEVGLKGARLPWFHPRQTWWLLGRALPPEEQLNLLTGVVLRCDEWAGSVDRALRR